LAAERIVLLPESLNLLLELRQGGITNGLNLRHLWDFSYRRGSAELTFVVGITDPWTGTVFELFY